MLSAKSLSGIPRLTHGFFTRRDGFSSGPFASLNCGLGSGDDRDSVLRNRAYCAEKLSVQPSHLLTVSQQHTPYVVTVTDRWEIDDAPIADAMVTTHANIALAILAADCAPVLLVDPDARVIGAVHAGWKGALSGIVEKTVTAMTALGAQSRSLYAAVGPCIGPLSYQVGPEFKTRFTDADKKNTRYFFNQNNDGQSQFDLPSYVCDKLARVGISNIDHINADTCIDETLFFSYRRACIDGVSDYGRQLSGIALMA